MALRDEDRLDMDEATNSAGQSGDLQGLHGAADGDASSVEELLADGQYFEAEFLSGVENAPDADQGPVRTHQLRMDDVPEEYLEPDNPDVSSQ